MVGAGRLRATALRAVRAEERGSSFGIFGGSSSALLQKCLRVLGRDIAQMIETGKYRTRIT